MYYIGHTEDVFRRFEEHNNPVRFSKFTAKATPWTIAAFFPLFATRSEAMAAEKFIKKQKSRRFTEELINQKADLSVIKSLLKLE
jgi:putative endonuclease